MKKINKDSIIKWCIHNLTVKEARQIQYRCENRKHAKKLKEYYKLRNPSTYIKKGVLLTDTALDKDIEFENIGTKAGSGTGLTADNVHSASLNNITCTGFEKGFYIFAFQSRIEMLYSYQCTTGIEFYGECTSLTVQSCWAREGTTGILVGPSVTYCTFLNCAVDDCFVPYSVAGNNNDFNNCGAEIDLAAYNASISPAPAETAIAGFFAWDSSTGGASTVTISGGRFIMTSTQTNTTCLYSVASASNESSVVIVSRMTSNSFDSPDDGFVGGKLRVFCSDSCSFADTFKLNVVEGDYGSLRVNGKSGGTLRRYATPGAKVGSSQDDADAMDNMLEIVIEEIIDFPQAVTDTEQVFIKHHGTAADSFMQGKVEVWPMVKTGTTFAYQEGYFWGVGSSNGDTRNPMMTTIGTPDTGIDGTIMDYKGNDASGYQNYYLSRTAIACKCFVRITASGWADQGFRDTLITLTVGPNDA